MDTFLSALKYIALIIALISGVIAAGYNFDSDSDHKRWHKLNSWGKRNLFLLIIAGLVALMTQGLGDYKDARKSKEDEVKFQQLLRTSDVILHQVDNLFLSANILATSNVDIPMALDDRRVIARLFKNDPELRYVEPFVEIGEDVPIELLHGYTAAEGYVFIQLDEALRQGKLNVARQPDNARQFMISVLETHAHVSFQDVQVASFFDIEGKSARYGLQGRKNLKHLHLELYDLHVFSEKAGDGFSVCQPEVRKGNNGEWIGVIPRSSRRNASLPQ